MEKPTPLRDIEHQFARTIRFTVLILAVSCAGLFWNPRDPVIWGFVVGGLVGILNAFFLVRRMRRMVELREDKARAYMRHNFYTRMGLVIAVVFFASRVDFLSVYGVGAGLLLVSCVTVVDAVVTLNRYYAARNASDAVDEI